MLGLHRKWMFQFIDELKVRIYFFLSLVFMNDIRPLRWTTVGFWNRSFVLSNDDCIAHEQIVYSVSVLRRSHTFGGMCYLWSKIKSWWNEILVQLLFFEFNTACESRFVKRIVERKQYFCSQVIATQQLDLLTPWNFLSIVSRTSGVFSWWFWSICERNGLLD